MSKIAISQIFLFKVPIFLVSFLILGGCGYQLEGTNPPLPKKAKTIAIRPIDNRTFQSDLETRLVKYLNQLLRNNASVTLSGEGNADLILIIRLDGLTKEKSSISTSGLAVEEQLTLVGNVSLVDQNQHPIWSETQLTAKAALLYEKGEDVGGITSSTAGRGVDDVTQAFANTVYERIFFSF